jgi:hypothetical protein
MRPCHSAFADGVDVRVRRLAAGIDGDAATLADRQARCARQLVSRPNPRRKHDDVGLERGPIRKNQPATALRARENLFGVLLQMDYGTQPFDLFPQQPPGRVVELRSHEARRELDDVGLEPEVLQRLGRFQAEQAAADDGAHPGAQRGGGDRLEVLDRAVDEAVAPVPAGDSRHERRGAGGEHQLVVRDFLVARRAHDLALDVDRQHLVVEAQRDARGGEELVLREVQVGRRLP